MIGSLKRRLFARHDSTFYFRTLESSEAPSVPPGYFFSELSLPELESCALAQQRGRIARFIRRFDDGYRCAGFKDSQGEVVAYVWIACGDGKASSVPIWRDIRVMLADRDVLFWDCHTAEQHAGRGLYRLALRLAGARLAAHGKQCAWIESKSDNLASHRGIIGAGFVPATNLSIIDIVGLYWQRTDARQRWRRLSGPLQLGKDIPRPQAADV